MGLLALYPLGRDHPVLYVLPAYLAIWVLGLGGFYNADFAAAATSDYGFGGAPMVVGLIGYV